MPHTLGKCKTELRTNFEAFMAVMIQVEVFWAVTPCSGRIYQRFGGSCCLHLHVILRLFFIYKFTITWFKHYLPLINKSVNTYTFNNDSYKSMISTTNF